MTTILPLRTLDVTQTGGSFNRVVWSITMGGPPGSEADQATNGGSQAGKVHGR
jgi:hypothetical protein